MKKMYVMLLLFGVICSCQKDDDETPDPTEVSISSIKIITMPLTDNGSGWDLNSEADVFFTVENANTVLYSYNVTNRKENLNQFMLPAVFPMAVPYRLPSINQVYHITLYDYDDLSTNDLISKLSFNPEEFKSNRPLTKTISGLDAIIEISFIWN